MAVINMQSWLEPCHLPFFWLMHAAIVCTRLDTERIVPGLPMQMSTGCFLNARRHRSIMISNVLIVRGVSGDLGSSVTSV